MSFSRKGLVSSIATVTIAALMAVAGCTPAPPVPPAGAGGGGASTPAPGGTVEDSGDPPKAASKVVDDVAVTAASPADLQKKLEALHGEGKVVLVDFWGTWCVPCRKNFPHTMELLGAHAKDGLAVITVAIEDDAESGRPGAVEFLTEQKASGCVNFISALPLDDAIEKFEIDGGALPHYRVYGRDGKLVKKFVSGDDQNPFDHTDIASAVEKALEAKAAE